MSSYLTSLGIDRLSRDERLVLVQEIWDSIAGEESPPVWTEAQREELKRRMADDDANPDDTVDWEQVKREALARLDKKV
jgi:putative addiction module component (TIGR02574 family)